MNKQEIQTHLETITNGVHQPVTLKDVHIAGLLLDTMDKLEDAEELLSLSNITIASHSESIGFYSDLAKERKAKLEIATKALERIKNETDISEPYYTAVVALEEMGVVDEEGIKTSNEALKDISKYSEDTVKNGE